jgi:hypothetical protein
MKILLTHPFYRIMTTPTDKKISPHALTHVPHFLTTEGGIEAIATVCKAHQILARLPIECDIDLVKGAFEGSGITLATPTADRPVVIKVTTNAPYVHMGGTNISIVIKTSRAVKSALRTGVQIQDMALMTRHGSELFPMLKLSEDGKYVPSETDEIVVSGWKPNYSATDTHPNPDNQYQAGTQFFGRYIPGTAPDDSTSLFFKFFPDTDKGNQDLLAAYKVFVNTPDDQYVALSYAT